MWLVLKKPEVDVCMKDPGYPVEATLSGDIADFVAVILGHVTWKEKIGKGINVESDRAIGSQIAKWFER